MPWWSVLRNRGYPNIKIHIKIIANAYSNGKNKITNIITYAFSDEQLTSIILNGKKIINKHNPNKKIEYPNKDKKIATHINNNILNGNFIK
jgi:disulfide oxidoreductase YuzD